MAWHICTPKCSVVPVDAPNRCNGCHVSACALCGCHADPVSSTHHLPYGCRYCRCIAMDALNLVRALVFPVCSTTFGCLLLYLLAYDFWFWTPPPSLRLFRTLMMLATLYALWCARCASGHARTDLVQHRIAASISVLFPCKQAMFR